MKKALLSCLFSLLSLFLSSQTNELTSLSNDALKNQLETFRKDSTIAVDTVWNILSSWNKYPHIEKTGIDYLFVMQDPGFGEVPFKVFIPKNYQSNTPTPLLLKLHGAVGRNNFENAYGNDDTADDFFFNYFSKQGYIIVRPFADVQRAFDWVTNHYNGSNNTNRTNKTFNSLENVIIELKKILNVDDSKIFAFGFSDGADGAFGLDVYKPSVFAGFVAYNSILTNIFAHNIYLGNTMNRPLYLIHSDKDEIRPVQQTRLLVRAFDSLQSPVLYKEYTGYTHFDKHLEKDLPFSSKYLNTISRNAFQKNIYWETDDYANNACDWIRITSFDTIITNAKWHKEINAKSYNAKENIFENAPYYGSLNKSAAVHASYNNNVFDIQTSRVKELEILISPVMVNIEDPVTVLINGKEVFNGKVSASRKFMLENFNKQFDRQALWMASLKIKVKNKCKQCNDEE